MNFLKNTINNWLQSVPVNQISAVRCDSDNGLHDNDAQHVYVFNAIGGKVVEFRKYDSSIDRLHISRYIISDDKDFGQSLAKIVNMEQLR